tara:strand:+ start:1051 stop:1503 length:453 start_codon:yes stop_codon:yes gene_type:complete
VKTEAVYPRNKWARNCRVSNIYLDLLRNKSRLGKLLGRLIGCEINCDIPENLVLGHPNGIVVGENVILEKNVMLNHQITLGGKNPYFDGDSTDDEYPHLKEGVYVGAGARILGNCVIGEWAIVGANAVVTKDVPANATVVGFNKIVEIRD